MSVQLFESEVLDVCLTSVVSDDGEIYFKARDVATALGYTNTNEAIRDHVREEYKVKYDDIKGSETLPLHPHTIFVTEPGFYFQSLFSAQSYHLRKPFKTGYSRRFFPLSERRARTR